MKKLLSLFLGFLMTVVVISFSNTAFAAYCRTIPGHWSNGYWIPAKTKCWGGHRRQCRWVSGYRDSRGYWHYGHRVCR